MPNPGESQPTNAEISEAMRAFSKQSIEIGFWGSSNPGVRRSSKSTIYAPFWLNAIGVLIAIALFMFLNILLPRENTEVPEPFKSNYALSWVGFVLLIAAGL